MAIFELLTVNDANRDHIQSRADATDVPSRHSTLAGPVEKVEPVIVHPRNASWNFGTHMARIVRRAGLEPWPKLFQNLRLTRQNELSATTPIPLVCEWIGNSIDVAQEHYLRASDADFARVAGACEGEKVVRTGAESHHLERNGAETRSISPGKTAILAVSMDSKYTPQESNL